MSCHAEFTSFFGTSATPFATSLMNWCMVVSMSVADVSGLVKCGELSEQSGAMWLDTKSQHVSSPTPQHAATYQNMQE